MYLREIAGLARSHMLRLACATPRHRPPEPGVAGCVGGRASYDDVVCETARSPKILAPIAVSPLADALGPLLERPEEYASQENASGSSTCVAEVSGWVDPAEVLAVTLDLAGSMKLDAHLQGRVSRLGEDSKKAHRDETQSQGLMKPEEEHGGEGADGGAFSGSQPAEISGCRTGEAAQELRTELLGRFNQLRASVMRRMDEVQSGRSRLADAERLYGDLEAKDLLARRNPRAIAAVARSGSESYLLVVFNCLDRVRGEVRTLRAELAPGVAGLSSAAARIQAFDALLESARFRFTSQLFARIPPALAERFAAQLQGAVKALPESPSQEDMKPWYADDGWVHEFHVQARRIVEAAIEHEWSGLVGWLEAAIEAEAASSFGS